MTSIVVSVAALAAAGAFTVRSRASPPARPSMVVEPSRSRFDADRGFPLTGLGDRRPATVRGVRLGLHLDHVPQAGLDPLHRVESTAGPIEVVHWFQAWGSDHRRFRPGWLDAVAESGRSGLISWEPWALTGDRVQPAFDPVAIAAGHHDRYVDAWAAGFAARDDGPWYLRPMHEMNGTWYPWGQVPGVTPDDVVAAWIHLRRRFELAGAESVAWVWCPLVDDGTGPPFEVYHPGPEHVDVLALDGYNWGSTKPEWGGWRSPAELFGSGLARLAELGDQPRWLAEVGCAPEGGDKARWTADLLDLARTSSVATVVFFGLDKERDWRIDADPRVAEVLRRRARP